MTDEIIVLVCTKCKEPKAAGEFNRDFNSKRGFTTRCKECLKAAYDRTNALRRVRRQSESVRETEKAYASEYNRRPEVKERRAAYSREYRKRPGERERNRKLRYRSYLRLKDTATYKEQLKANQKRWHEKSPRLNLHMAIKHAAKRRPTIKPATTDELMELWRKQDNKCAVSGVEMTWGKGKLMPTSISLDRYDGTKGYELDNIRLVCYQVNTFRGRWSDAQMLQMAKAIVANMEAPAAAKT